MPRDVSKFGAEDFKQFVDSFDVVLSDCDGKFHPTG